MALTARQLAFAQAYARCGVAEQAAIEAGYSPATARKNAAHKLLTIPAVKAEIKRLQKKTAAQAELSIQAVLDEFKLVGFADLADFVEWDKNGVRLRDSKKLDAAKRRAIIEVSQGRYGIKIKLADKLVALDRLGKHLGMFVEKIEHSGEIKSTAPVINLTLTTAKKADPDG